MSNDQSCGTVASSSEITQRRSFSAMVKALSFSNLKTEYNKPGSTGSFEIQRLLVAKEGRGIFHFSRLKQNAFGLRLFKITALETFFLRELLWFWVTVAST